MSRWTGPRGGPSQAAEPVPVRLVFVLALLVAFGPVSIDMYLPSLPAIGRAFDASTGSVQLTLSAFFIGFSLGQLLYGPLSDRLGRRPILLTGISLYIVTSALCALSPTIEHLVAFRFLHAVGGGAGTVVGRAVVRDRFDTDSAARILSLMMLVTAIAPLAAPIAGGYVLKWLGWRGIFWLLAAFGGCCWIAVAFALPETNPPARRGRGRLAGVFLSYVVVLRQPRALGCILCGGLAFAGMFAYISGTPFVYIELFGVAPQAYGYLFGLNVIGLAIGSVLNARLVVLTGALRMMTAGACAIAAAGVALLLAAYLELGGLPGLVVPLFLFVGPLNLIAANAIALASADFPQQAGAVAALFGAAQFGLGAVSGLVVGQLHDGTALPMAATIAACGLAAVAVNRWIVRSDSR